MTVLNAFADRPARNDVVMSLGSSRETIERELTFHRTQEVSGSTVSDYSRSVSAPVQAKTARRGTDPQTTKSIFPNSLTVSFTACSSVSNFLTSPLNPIHFDPVSFDRVDAESVITFCRRPKIAALQPSAGFNERREMSRMCGREESERRGDSRSMRDFVIW